jgi:hypothetical protein
MEIVAENSQNMKLVDMWAKSFSDEQKNDVVPQL